MNFTIQSNYQLTANFQMTVYAPLRVSRDKQDVRNQKFGIKHYAETLGLEPVQYSEDVVSALVEWRKRGIGEVMKTVEAGDHIIVSEISRLARTTLEVLDQENELLDAQTNRVSAAIDRYAAAYEILNTTGLLTAEYLGLGVPTYDPAAYYNAVKDAPVVNVSPEGKRLDRVLKALGKK